MANKKFPIPVIIICILLFLSCKKSDNKNSIQPATFSVDKNSLNLGGATKLKDTLTVNTSGSWSVTITPAFSSWLSTNRTTGTGNAQIIVSATELNHTGSPRTGTLTFSPLGQTTFPAQSIMVTQGIVSMDDSVNLLTGLWKLIKDSSTNIGGYYFHQGGTMLIPIPGVYIGGAADYYNFKPNGIVDMYGNGQLYISPYKLHVNNRIVIDGLQVHDSGKVIKLTPSEAVFDWQKTSYNGGKYFRRTYLGK